MASCEVDAAALKGVMKMAKAFGSFTDVWLEAGEGAVSFRSGHVARYALVGITMPAPGCEGVPKRFLGLPFEKLESTLKGVKGKLGIEWSDAADGEGSGYITFKSGGKKRSFLLLAKEHSDVVRDVPSIPAHVEAKMKVDELKRFFDEAQEVGLVEVTMTDDSRLMLKALAEVGDKLEWDAGACTGEKGFVAKWHPENCVQLMPVEYDGEEVIVRWHPRGMRMDWTVGGQPCAIAIAPMADPE